LIKGFIDRMRGVIPLERLVDRVKEVMKVFTTITVKGSDDTLRQGGVMIRDAIIGEGYFGSGLFELEKDEFKDTGEGFKDEIFGRSRWIDHINKFEKWIRCKRMIHVI